MDLEPSRYIGDSKSRILAERLRRAAEEVSEPQRSRILDRLPNTIFVSHTSRDDGFIKTHVLETVQAICPDPFFHSIKTGAADAYERIVGLSLLSAGSVLSILSVNACNSDYFLAEQHLAISERKRIIVFCIDHAMRFVRSIKDSANVAQNACIIDASNDLEYGIEQLRSAMMARFT